MKRLALIALLAASALPAHGATPPPPQPCDQVPALGIVSTPNPPAPQPCQTSR